MFIKLIPYICVIFFYLYSPAHPSLFAQEIDLDKLINDSTSTGVRNLNASINSALNCSAIQSIQTLGALRVNLAFTSAWALLNQEQQTGALAHTGNFNVPFFQMEIGLPYRVHLLGRAMAFKLGHPNPENAFLWGVGMRYTMIEEASSLRVGFLVLYQQLERLRDFDIQMLLIQTYLGYFLPRIDFYLAPGASRSVFNMHLDGQPDHSPASLIDAFLRLNGGMHVYPIKRLALTGNIVFGEYLALAVGGSITLF